MSNKKTGGWGPVEIAVLAIILLVFCAGIGIVFLMVGGFFVEEELARENAPAPTAAANQAAGDAFAPITDASQGGTGAQQPEADAPQTITLSTPASAPGTTVTVQGEGWPAGGRVIISLVPSAPPNFTVNSAIVGQDGRFSIEMIVPSDPRWLDESPVPVLAASDNGQTTAQAALTIVSPPDNAPVATPSASNNVVVVSSVSTAAPAAPPATAPQLTTTANLNVRAGPGTNYPILGVLPLGQQVEIIGRNQEGTWWQIKYPGAKQGYGWVSAEFAQASNIGNVPVVQAPPAPAQPTPAPTATPQPGLNITDWRGEYFNNENLQGPPVLVRNDVAISFDWGLGSPDPGIPNDYFSARWSRQADFSAGTYRFYARVDDGVRLWVDGALLINQWREQSPTTYAADIYLAEGRHSLMMEYNELAGGATAILSWNRVDTYPDWKAEYYPNPNLQGPPALVRNEGSINYNWGAGSPASGIPADNFSARWSRVSYFDGGDYLFRIVSDDGHRVFFDNNLILDNWRDGNTGILEARRSVPAGLHELRVEYYERRGDALIGFSWQRVDRPQVGPLAVISGPDNGVVGQPVRFDGRRSRPGDSPIDKYEWDFGDGTRTRGDRVSHTYQASGDYRVRLRVTDKNGLRDTTELRVRVDDDLQASTPPYAVLDGPSTAKVGEPVSFSGRRSASLSPIVDYRWNFNDGTTGRGQDVSHLFSQAGTYNVILTVVAENGLRSSDSLSIRIDNPLLPADMPVAKISAPSQGQTGQPLTFDASQSTAKHPLVSWQWNFGDGASANGLTVPHAFNAPGTYNVTLTVTDDQGQSNTANQIIAIADPPPSNQPPVPAISGPDTAIAGQAITFDGSGTQSANPITAYNWDFGDGNTASGPTVNHTYTQVGSFTVSLNVTDDQGQQASATKSVTITPQPQPAPLTANLSGPSQGQVGQTLTFDGQSSTSAAPLNTIQWDFGDGNTASGQLVVSHAYQSSGAYTVLMSLVNDLGQNDTTSLQVTIQDPPPANSPPQPAIQSDATTIAAGGTINFDASGSQAASPIVSYDWDFGDGTTGSGQLVSHDYTQPGTYDVTLTVTDQNGQSSSSVQTVTVTSAAQPAPLTPSISAPTAQGQVGQPITFDGQSSTSAAPLNSVQWDFGDGTTAGGTTLNDLVVSHTYQQPGDYTVQLTLANDLNQSSTSTFDVSIQPPPPPPPPSLDDEGQLEPPTAEIEGPTQANVGEAVVFDGGYSQASSPIAAYQWGFGDGVTASGMGATHAYAAPGMYNVTLNIVDENGLSSSASHFIEIIAPGGGEAQPEPLPAEPEVEPAEPALPETQPAEPPAPEVEPAEPVAPESEPAEPPAPEVLPAEPPAPAQPPTANISGPGQAQAGAPVSFSASASVPGSSAIVAYQWGFGDGGVDSGPEVTYVYQAEGQYQVTLTVIDENGLSQTASWPLFVGPSQADLDAQRAAEEEAQRQAAEEAQRQADEAAQQQAEEAQRQAEEEARRQAEEEAQRQAEEAQRQAEEEARRQAEEEAQRQAAEEAQRQAEEEARRQAEDKKAKEQSPEPEQQPDAPAGDGSDGN